MPSIFQLINVNSIVVYVKYGLLGIADNAVTELLPYIW